MKTCKICNIDKHEFDFYKDKSQLDGLTRDCKICRKSKEQGYYYKHRDKRVFQAKNSRLKKTNAEEITTERYSSMLVEQENKCGICNTVMHSPYIDHDHATGKIRMLLCHHCNCLLGNAKDNPNILKSAIEYLKKFNQ
jgi:hypothetical protein